jgi:hypothetical protein
MTLQVTRGQEGLIAGTARMQEVTHRDAVLFCTEVDFDGLLFN